MNRFLLLVLASFLLALTLLVQIAFNTADNLRERRECLADSYLDSFGSSTPYDKCEVRRVR